MFVGFELLTYICCNKNNKHMIQQNTLELRKYGKSDFVQYMVVRSDNDMLKDRIRIKEVAGDIEIHRCGLNDRNSRKMYKDGNTHRTTLTTDLGSGVYFLDNEESNEDVLIFKKQDNG